MFQQKYRQWFGIVANMAAHMVGENSVGNFFSRATALYKGRAVLETQREFFQMGQQKVPHPKMRRP
jgi:hypothetical protein